MVKEYKLPYNFEEDAKQPTSDPRRTITASKVQEQFEYLAQGVQDQVDSLEEQKSGVDDAINRTNNAIDKSFLLDGSKPMEGDIDMGNHIIKNAQIDIDLKQTDLKEVSQTFNVDMGQRYNWGNGYYYQRVDLQGYAINNIFLNAFNWSVPNDGRSPFYVMGFIMPQGQNCLVRVFVASSFFYIHNLNRGILQFRLETAFHNGAINTQKDIYDNIPSNASFLGDIDTTCKYIAQTNGFTIAYFNNTGYLNIDILCRG